jgi:hypothetical protein
MLLAAVYDLAFIILETTELFTLLSPEIAELRVILVAVSESTFAELACALPRLRKDFTFFLIA